MDILSLETRGYSAGEILRAIRKQRKLSLREVTAATREIARELDHEEFCISPGRLSQVENTGVVPNIFRIYSLSVVYSVDLREMLSWFGIPNS
jgi:transcriptional regulator with XRE-family HTH domain